MRRAVLGPFVFALALPASAVAQPADAMTLALDALSDEAPLALTVPGPFVVHVHADLEPLAAPLVRSLSRRVEGEVVLGAPPIGGLCVAIEEGHACVAPLEAHDTRSALVLYRDAGGRFYETEIALEEARAPAVRALAIAIDDVRDAARSAPPMPSPSAGASAPRVASGSSWVYVEREGGLFGRQRSIESIARPTLYLRALVGLTTSASTVLFGPGIGLGLCVGDFCAVLEGDVPVFEERRVVDGGRTGPDDTISFRPIFIAARLGYRPLRAGPVTGGITWGLLDRLGNAWLGSTGENQLVNDLGMRQSIELSIEISRPFEFVIEVGLDVTLSRARFFAAGQQAIDLSDDVTGWGVTALRVRP